MVRQYQPASISQLGGIVGGVGQTLAISVPITQMGRDYNRVEDAGERERIAAGLLVVTGACTIHAKFISYFTA